MSAVRPSGEHAVTRWVPGSGAVRFAAIALLAAGGCSPSEFADWIPSRAQPDDSEIVASVGDRRITAQELRFALGQQGAEPGSVPSGLREAALESLIRTEILAQAALDAGFDADPEVARGYKSLLAERFWREQMKQFRRRMDVTEEVVRSAYEARKAEFAEIGRSRGAVIYFRFRADESKEATLERARSVRAEAIALEDEILFGSLAERHSDHSESRNRQGDIGWVRADSQIFRVDPAAIRALLALNETGEVSEPVVAERGVYLVKLVGRTPERVRPYEEVARKIRDELRRDAMTALQDELFQELRSRYDIDSRSRLAARIEPLTPKDGPRPPSFPVSAPN